MSMPACLSLYKSASVAVASAITTFSLWLLVLPTHHMEKQMR